MYLPNGVKIAPQRRYRSKSRKSPVVIGLDTETLRGKAFLIADSEGNWLWPESDIEVLNWLLYSKRYQGSLNCFWNLMFDAQAILKWLPEKVVMRIWKDTSAFYAGFTISYLPRKLLKISRGHKTVRFYDISQFYQMRLEEAGQKYLGEGKYKGVDVSRFSEGYIKMHRENIIRYCLKDADLCQRLAQRQIEWFNSLGIFPRTLYSTASVSERHFLDRCWIPKIDCIPKDVIDISFHSYRGGHFEVFKRGHFRQSYLYDINSAYAYQLTLLPDISKGRWVKSSKPLSQWGFGKVSLKMPNAYRGKIMVRSEPCYYPIGEWEAYLTSSEIRFLEEAKIDHKILSGWWWMPDKVLYPFKKEMYRLYKLKQQESDPGMYHTIKVLMNSLYGKTWQQNPSGETGNLFNSVYASWITSGVRVAIQKWIGKKEKSIIGTATDSCIFSSPQDFGLNGEMGKLSLKARGEGVFIGSGIFTIGHETKFRGFKLVESWFQLLKEHRHEDKISMIVSRPCTLGDIVVKHRKHNFDDLNVWITEERKLDLNFDVKRVWERNFQDSEDCLSHQIDSMPRIYADRQERPGRSFWSNLYEKEDTTGSELYRQIRELGGIRAYRDGSLRGEYRGLPLCLKNRRGLPLDEIADMLGYETDNELLNDIERETFPSHVSEY